MEPKIRFKGFEEEWRKTKYSSFATIRRGLTYSPENIASKGIRVLRSSNIDEDVFIRSEEDVFVHSSCINIPLAKDGDILITAANGSPRLVGKHAVINNLNEDKVVPGGFMILASSKEPYFLNSCMGAPWYKTFLKTGVAGGNGAIGNLNKNTLEEYEFYTPSNKLERDEIASYFTTLDAQISASTSHLASLKQTKAASLQAMFPQEGETVPKIRFKGFEGEWRTCPLYHFAKKRTEKNTKMLYNITLTNSAEFGIIDQRNFFDHEISNSENINGYYVVRNQDFVYNPRISSSAPVGPINQNKLGYTGVMSPLYLVFEINGINRDFLEIFFHTTLWHKYMFDNGNTGARFDRLAISDEDFMKMPIPHIDIEEQQAIVSFFTSLDRQISLHTKRLEKLKQIKAACLEKMFV